MKYKPEHTPSGYKPSPLGIIPKDWEVKRLGEVCINNGDYGLNAPATDYDENLPTYLRITDIDDDGNFNQSDKKSVDSPLSENYYLKDGDIVFARTGATVGKTYLYDKNDGELVYAGFLIKFTPDKERILPYFLKSQTNTREYANWVSITSQRSGQPGINAAEYCSYKFALPPLSEQKRICDLLFLWDTAIAKQTALIEQLTLRKRGLMQQLLTGKKRLKGFEGEWKILKLGECGKFLSNNTLSREQLNERSGTVQNIHYGDILIKYPSILDCDKVTLPFITESAYKDSMTDFVKNGDIVISDTAEDETVGKACEVQNIGTNKILAGLHTMLFRPDEGLFSPFFLGYYINSEVYHSKLIPLIQGIKVCSIGKQAMQYTTISIPTIDEQNAIASVLVNADKEIEIQKQKLAAMQEQKKGLMQVLLTGKRRVTNL